MILIWGEDRKPPRYGPLIYNTLFAAACLGVQIFGISPNDVMGVAGASTGFVMIYLHPITIHFKVLLSKQAQEGPKEKLTSAEGDIDIPTFLEGKDTHFAWEYIIHGLIMAVGVTILVINILQLVGVMN